MHGQTTTTRTALPAELASARAKLVYLYLETHGTTSLCELERHLEMRKITLYGVLGTLCDRGLVSRNGERYAPA
jgi:DNA-binding IclR family transcriptional regulator